MTRQTFGNENMTIWFDLSNGVILCRMDSALSEAISCRLFLVQSQYACMFNEV